MRVLLRIVVVLFSYLAACVLASAVFLTGAMIGAGEAMFGPSDPPQEVVLGVAMLSVFGVFLTVPLSVVPATVMVVLAEFFRWRQLWLHLLTGAGIGAFAAAAMGILEGDTSIIDLTPLVIAAGTLAALLYWWLAGQHAGKWRDPRPAVEA